MDSAHALTLASTTLLPHVPVSGGDHGGPVTLLGPEVSDGPTSCSQSSAGFLEVSSY